MTGIDVPPGVVAFDDVGGDDDDPRGGLRLAPIAAAAVAGDQPGGMNHG